ncbi:TPA: hypothetical protein U0364_003366, partial [Listeria monocytogenes]|nr:hypothetical protein [Listeria monocytogenes]
DDVKQVVVQEPATAQTSGPGQQTPAQANVASEKEAEKATPADKVTGDVAASEKPAKPAENTEATVQTNAQEPAKPADTKEASTEKAAVAEEVKAANAITETPKTEVAEQNKQAGPTTAQDQEGDKREKSAVEDKIVANPKVAKKDRLPEPAQKQGAVAERMVADQAQPAPVNA